MQQPNRRQWVRGISVALLVWGAATATTAQTATYQGYPVVRVTVNGQPLVATVPPIIMEDVTLVPLRSVVERLGLSVNWDDATRTVKVSGGAGLQSDNSAGDTGEATHTAALEAEIKDLRQSLEKTKAERDELRQTFENLSESRGNWMNITEKVVTDKAVVEGELARLAGEKDLVGTQLEVLQDLFQIAQEENQRLAADVKALRATLTVTRANSPAPLQAQPLPFSASERGVAVTVTHAEPTDGGLILYVQAFNGGTRPLIVLQNQFRVIAGANQYMARAVNMLNGEGDVLGGELTPGAIRSGRMFFPDVPNDTTHIRLMLKFGSEATASPYIVTMGSGTTVALHTISDPWDMFMTLRLTD